MGSLLGSIFVVICCISWIMNIVWLCSENVVGLAILRGIGIFLFPIGIILGFV